MRLRSSLARRARAHLAGAALAALSLGAHAEPARAPGCAGVDYNAMILKVIKGLPAGGGYSLDAGEVQLPTITTHNIGGGHWELRVHDGHPSHCTSAAYALFTHLVAVLQNDGAIRLGPSELHALEITRAKPDGTALVDGEGSYGIFNANGAGVAAFLKHTGTGMSFRDDKLNYARAGDFLKIFWNENVGASERGHQVVYLGRHDVAGRDMICFWGSQRQKQKKRDGHTEALYFPAQAGTEVQDGYGAVCRPRGDIKAMVFSRVTCMEHLASGLAEMEARAAAAGGAPTAFIDQYLYALRTQSSDQATLDRTYDIRPAPAAAFADVGIAPPR